MPRVSSERNSPRHTPLASSNISGPPSTHKQSIIEILSDEENDPRPPAKSVAKQLKKKANKSKEILEISSDEDEPPSVPKPAIPEDIRKQLLQFAKLKQEHAKLKKANDELRKSHKKDVAELKAQLDKRQEAPSSKLDPDDLEVNVSCEICTAIMWVPYILDCGHAFCGQCLTDWFQTILNNFNATNPQAGFLRNQARMYNPFMPFPAPPTPDYTCPTCRENVRRKPIEAFAMKDLVRKVAAAQGQSSPRKELPAPPGRKGRGRGRAHATSARADPFAIFFT